MIKFLTSNCPRCKGTGKVSKPDPDSLRKAREEAGISLRAMADALGFSAPYLSDIERGNRTCPIQIAKAYTAFVKK